MALPLFKHKQENQHTSSLGLQELLLPALNHFQAFGNPCTASQSLLALAQLEHLANQPAAALQLLQQAVEAGVDAATSCKTVQLYAEVCSQQGSRAADAVAVVQSGIKSMEKLARSAA